MKPYFPILLFISAIMGHSCQNNGQLTYNSTPSPGSAVAMSGFAIFNQNCKLCHGADGRLGLNGAKDLTASQLSMSERVNIITHGKNLMTPFNTLLSAAEIDSVAAFSLQLGIE